MSIIPLIGLRDAQPRVAELGRVRDLAHHLPHDDHLAAVRGLVLGLTIHALYGYRHTRLNTASTR